MTTARAKHMPCRPSPLPPSESQFQLLFCILPFPSFTDALLECSKFGEMINNIHVIGNDVLSSAEDGPLHWSARSKSLCFHGGSDSASSDLMRIDQTQLRGKDPLCTLWHGQCVLNNYLLCFPDLKKKANIVKQKLPGLRYISASYVSLAAIIRSPSDRGQRCHKSQILTLNSIPTLWAVTTVKFHRWVSWNFIQFIGYYRR